MQRAALFLACLLVCIACHSQQYPFVHYTPKDGLVNGRVRSVFQDKKGRMYFLTFGGLSVHDGTGFKNYTVQDGLSADIVNDVLERPGDTMWIACNFSKLNYLANSRIHEYKTPDGFCPVINQFLETKDGKIYVAADEGLFLFDKIKFSRLPFITSEGKDVGQFISQVSEWRNLLLIHTDQSMNSYPSNFFVYDRVKKKIIAEEKSFIYSTTVNRDGSIYFSSPEGIQQLDPLALSQGQLKYLPLPAYYGKQDPVSSQIYVDRQSRLWLLYHPSKIVRIDTAGNKKEMSVRSGMGSNNFSSIFEDREGIFWFTLNDEGVDKLSVENIEIYDNIEGELVQNFYADRNSDTVYFISPSGRTIYPWLEGTLGKIELQGAVTAPHSFSTRNERIYISNGNQLDEFRIHGNRTATLSRQIQQKAGIGQMIFDPFGRILVHVLNGLLLDMDTSSAAFSGTGYIDQMCIDPANRIWAIDRMGSLYVFNLQPPGHQPSLRLVKTIRYDRISYGMTARSITADRSGQIWLGTRYNGLYRLTFDKDLELETSQQFNVTNGLSDNFITHLACDNENNIWIATASGIDKLSYENNRAIIQNITRAGHIYKYIRKIQVTKSGVAWSLADDMTIIRIGKEKEFAAGGPELFVTSFRVGDSLYDHFDRKATFPHSKNTFTISVAAPSFYDENQVKYSYLLQGGGRDTWSEPSNNATFNLISLNPGKYHLYVKVIFPGGTYPEKTMDFAFTIKPPWWRTLWFRLGLGAVVLALLTLLVRFYYRRKLERQKITLEKQQAVEKERTRIATDIHDDLGSGLSRIRYLGETIRHKKSTQQDIIPDIEKISVFSDEMVDKMNEIIWALNEKNDSLEAMISYIRSYAVEYLTAHGLVCHLDIPGDIPEVLIKGETRRNVFLSVKESLHNIVKHAQATEVNIKISTQPQLEIRISDNGKGIDWDKIKPFSNGILNIKKRMTESGGTAGFVNKQGTTVALTLPLL